MTAQRSVDFAEEFARQAHGAVLNKHSGEHYILHVERVVAHLVAAGADETHQTVAWLHDVVEDTSVTLDQVLRFFGVEIAEAVDAITHRPGETRLAYYDRVGPNRLALAVKMSDLRDNTDPDRKECLPEATRTRLDTKYRTAHRALIPWIIHHLKEF